MALRPPWLASGSSGATATMPAPGHVAAVMPEQMPAAMEVLQRDPVTNVAILGWLEAAGYDLSRLGAQLWGAWEDGQLRALCYVGANLVPTVASPWAIQTFAGQALQWGRRCSSIVGPAASVAGLWEHLAPAWGPARQVRPRQPVMVLEQPVQVTPDPRVRLVTPPELDVLLPAAVAMFTEEVGVSPVVGPGRQGAYRARVAQLIACGHVFAWIEDGQVLFKAEVGALAQRVAQIQGVWMAPALRGQGLAAGCMAAVAELVQVFLAPTVSLYVNDFNTPARATYRRVGFHDVGTAMTVML